MLEKNRSEVKAEREVKVANIQKFTAVTASSMDTSQLDTALPIQKKKHTK